MGLDPGTLGGDAGTQTIWDVHKGTEAHQVVCPFSPPADICSTYLGTQLPPRWFQACVQIPDS